MPRRCSICASEQNAAITKMIQGGSSNSTVANRFNLHRSSVQRHRITCLSTPRRLKPPETSALGLEEDVATQSARFASTVATDDTPARLGELLGICRGRMQNALRRGDDDALSKLLREERALLDARDKANEAAREPGFGCPNPSMHEIFAGRSISELREIMAGLMMHGRENGSVCLKCTQYMESPAGRGQRRSVTDN
jgi:hypothetical protein